MNINEIDVASIDHVLTTTRAVRKRLDLERPVDNEIIYDCIDIAEQAPSGGNQGSRRWVVVRDPKVKAQLAELYMESAGQFMIGARDKIAGTGHPQERVMESAAYLAEHLAEVPAIIVPTIMGRHDDSGRPGLFDSVIQSVWSLCVALRARGLGTAWTTAILGKRDELREVLGVPETSTQIAMIPVAWFTGEDFRQAPRYSAREITGIDRYGHQWESGPSDPPCLADGPMTTVEVDIKASTDAVWQRVSDIELPVPFSEELVGVRWADGVDGPSLGAHFIGSNKHDAIGEWDVNCYVNRYVEGKEFGWASVSAENPGARWWFDLSSIAGATRVRFSVALGPGPSGISRAIEAMPDKEPRILSRRIQEHRGNMQRVIDGLAAELTRPPEDAKANPIFGD